MRSLPASSRTARHWPRFLLDLAVVGVLSSLTGNEHVYLRNITFSRVVADQRIGSEAALNGVLAEGFLKDRVTSRYRDFLNPSKADALRSLQRQPGITDEKMGRWPSPGNWATSRTAASVASSR